jgi:hypothetical protein
MIADPNPPLVHSIGYATPVTRQQRRWFSLRTTLLALLVAGFIQASLLVPFHFKRVFVDLHLKLPVPTQMWLDAGDLWNAAYGWAIAWPLAVSTSIGITLVRRPPRPGNERVKWLLFSNLALLAFIVVYVLTSLAVNPPMTTLIEGILGPRWTK